jgi:hypothetical protein
MSALRAAVLAMVLVGCNDLRQPCPGGVCGSSETHNYYEEPLATRMDIIVVMDDSPSMAAHQARALESLRKAFDSVFSALPAPVDVEMRVISSTAAGDAAVPGCGKLAASDCAVPPGGILRQSRTCGEPSNFDGAVATAVSCAARFPATGCGIEQPLAAIQASLESRGLRRYAVLVVVIVTDEDDCSSGKFDDGGGDGPELTRRCEQAERDGTLTPVSSYAGFLASLGRPVAISLIGGGERLRRFGEAFSGTTETDFFTEDWTAALTPIGARVAVKLGRPCISGRLVDRDLDERGLQPDCIFTEHPDGAPSRVLPACPANGAPCAQLIPDPRCTDSGFTFVVDRGGCYPATPAILDIVCATRL